MKKAAIKVYTTRTCPWCMKVKDYLKSHKLKYEEVDVGSDEKARNEMVEKSSQMGVPVIEIKVEGSNEPTIIVGFDQEAIDSALGI